MSKDGIPPIIHDILIHSKDHQKQVKRYEQDVVERMVELAVSQGEKKKRIDWQRVSRNLAMEHEPKTVIEVASNENMDWYKLACKLAKKYEPKLQDKTSRGRNLKWGWKQKMLLAVDVERLTKRGMTIDMAIKEISTSDYWINFLDKWEEYKCRDISAALKKRYKKHQEESKIVDRTMFGLRELPQKEWVIFLKSQLKNK